MDRRCFASESRRRKSLDVMRSVAYKTNKVGFGLISFTMIGLMDLSSLISLNVRQENGAKLRSVYPSRPPSMKTVLTIMCMMAFANLELVKKPISFQNSKVQAKTQVAQFCVFELGLEG